MNITASKVLLAIAAICGLLVAFSVHLGSLGDVPLVGASLFFGWLALLL